MRRLSWRPEMGWAPFVDELVIVFLGVLIALWVGRLANNIDWTSRDTKTRAALKFELGDALANLELRREVAPCLNRRLDTLNLILTRALSTKRLPETAPFPLSPGANWESGVWRSTVDSQTATKLPSERLTRLAIVYSNIDRLQQRNDREQEAWNRLATIGGPERATDGEEVDGLRASLNDARELERRMEIATHWMPGAIQESGFGGPLNAGQKREIDSQRERICAELTSN